MPGGKGPHFDGKIEGLEGKDERITLDPVPLLHNRSDIERRVQKTSGDVQDWKTNYKGEDRRRYK